MEKEQLLKSQLTRREFLASSAKAAIALPFLSSVGVEFSYSVPPPASTKTPEPGESHSKRLLNAEEEIHYDDSTNTQTALVVSGVFGVAIGSVASGKVEFGAKTIFPVSLAESYRMLRLNGADKNTFDHEQKELITSISLVPVLAAVAETADSTRVYVDSLFETERLSEDEAEALALEETHAGKHKIEDLTGKSIENCRDYLSTHQEEVVRIAAANAALVTIISPLATTYVGASSAESSFAPMTRALTKAYYAQEVVSAKEQSQQIHHQSVLQTSLDKAQKAMNGPLGYCNLSLAMAANTSGMAGIGDPPLIYSGIINQSPYNHALVSAEGFAISETANVIANNTWLKSLSLNAKASFYTKEFADYHGKTAKALTSIIFDGEARQGFLWGYAGQSKELTKILEVLGKAEAVTDANIAQLKDNIRTVSHPVLELDISEYLPRKKRGLANEVTKKKNIAVGITDRFKNKKKSTEDAKKEIEAEFDFEEALQELFGADKSGDFFAHARTIDDNKRKSNIARLGKTLLSIVNNGSDKYSETQNEVQDLSNSVSSKGSTQLRSKLENLMTDDKTFSEEDLKTLPHFFGSMGAPDVQKALTHALEHYRGSMRDHPRDELLGHASSEVAAALLTQLPAVPSLVHLTEKLLPKLVESKLGEKVPVDVINKKVAAILVATAVISSTADNVAAYLFGKAVLEEQFKEEYGQDLSYEYKWFANDAALLAAIVGGSLSKVGNGANFLISQVEAKIDGDTINVGKKKIDLLKSYANPYSIVQTGAVLTALMAHKKAIDEGLPNLYSIKTM